MDAELIKFILDNENEDVEKLILRQKEIFGYPVGFIADQIKGRKKAKDKLPTWYAEPNIIYPPQVNLEQSSSEITAQYKSDIIKSFGSGDTIVDLTGGFGIDSFFLSKKFKSTWYVEPNTELNKLVKSNHAILKANNIQHIVSTAEEALKSNQQYDWIYLDPSRKSKGKKVFKLEDCEPDVVALLPELFKHTKRILIKTSPLLDLKEGIKLLTHTKKIYVVSVDNECKEVLFFLEAGYNEEPGIICTNLPNDSNSFEFIFSNEEEAKVEYADPQEFIYEPNASILKAGAFKLVALKTGLKKMAVNTHLYTGGWIENFPGRTFKTVVLLNDVKNQIPTGKVNIISRNHPLSPEEIKKKFKLKDGGEQYLLAFSGVKKKFLMLAERIK